MTHKCSVKDITVLIIWIDMSEQLRCKPRSDGVEEKSHRCLQPGPSCSKLTTLLVKVLFNFICQYLKHANIFFLGKKLEAFANTSHFFNKKIRCIW